MMSEAQKCRPKLANHISLLVKCIINILLSCFKLANMSSPVGKIMLLINNALAYRGSCGRDSSWNLSQNIISL